MRTGPPPTIVLPPEAVDLYQSGAATIRDIAGMFGCSWSGARSALERAGVQFRPQRVMYRKPVAGPARCRGCGEDLNHPHKLGAHLPGCGVLERTS